MALLSKKQALSVKSETTQGSAATASASTDFIRLVDTPKIKPISEKIQRSAHREAFGTVAHVAGMQQAEITFKVEIQATGTSNTAYAPLHTLYKACGFVITGGTGGTNWTCTPSSTNIANHLGPATACTIDYYTDGLLYRIIGAVGTGKAILEAGKIGVWEFSMKGNYVATSDAAIPSITYTDTTPPLVASGVLKIDNTDFIVSKAEFDLGNKIEMVPDNSSASGLKGFRIVDREPKATVNPEIGLVATYDWWGKYMAGTALATSSIGIQCQTGATDKNFTKFLAINAQILEASPSSRNGIEAIDVTLQLNDTASLNDYMTIIVDNGS